MILNTNCYCSTAQNNSVNKAHVRGQNDSCAGMRMNNQDEDETKELRYHDSVLQREKLTCTKERRRAEGCTATKKGTDGVRGHQLVRESCNGKRQTVKRKCRGERVKEERGERWLPRQQQPAFSFFISPFCTHTDKQTHRYTYTCSPASLLPPSSHLWLVFCCSGSTGCTFKQMVLHIPFLKVLSHLI